MIVQVHYETSHNMSPRIILLCSRVFILPQGKDYIEKGRRAQSRIQRKKLAASRRAEVGITMTRKQRT